MQMIKTPRANAHGVFFRPDFFKRAGVKSCLLAWLVIWASHTSANCPAVHIDEVATVAHIYDADTLRLEDGRRVRVLGINAPETAGKKRAAEPLAQAGLNATQAFFRADKQVRLSYGKQRHDRYGRLLAHVYNTKGQSLAASLLREGLAFHIVVPPNASAAECLQARERQARHAGKGVWREKYWQARPAADLKLRDTGFLRIQGRIVKVTEAKDIWLELDGPVVLKIAAQDKRLFPKKQWRNWHGKMVEVNGWVVNRSSAETSKKGFKPLQLQLRSPYAITLLHQ